MSEAEEKCRRCGAPLGDGAGRYLMIITYIADADFVVKEVKGDLEKQISQVMSEIEKTSEEELAKQVYEKQIYQICRRCKESLSENPFPDSPPAPTGLTQ